VNSSSRSIASNYVEGLGLVGPWTLQAL
jgi:hypothetical protein